ncbi:dissimilatory sulfite reductase (desulfoviridin), alpha/beta subunit [Cryptobacterium curtum DSM 15641]|uniref:Ferredoxin n=1 Tax=Cryptobacterium curtum (strain ATCC 700683 / DSM 15641 / CCUG 43107 / 12-3) TaxID=469378 RepID=C7MLJ1_CRYCD|nr:4Fe-4S binding protein [Cryptobacterium curtum]ACU93797.1 dissimilatory sulfite reductase (desulfoviridin), alpha/beta subunit [Cryptobacterium curtum DSM 15641]
MAHPIISEEECIGCGICVDACPQEVLEVIGGIAATENEDACIACGDCLEECPMAAITEIVED